MVSIIIPRRHYILGHRLRLFLHQLWAYVVPSQNRWSPRLEHTDTELCAAFRIKHICELSHTAAASFSL